MSSFRPEKRPTTLKTNITKITKYIIIRVTQLGFNVVVTYSKRSRSRYLEVEISRYIKLKVRIADHPAGRWRRWTYDFDIHTDRPRTGSVDYIEFIDIVKSVYGENGL